MGDYLTIWGSTSDFISATGDTIPGVTTKALWDSEADATKFYLPDGDYISSNNGADDASYTATTRKLEIADTTGILVGMCVYIDSASFTGSNAKAYWEISSIDPNVSVTISGVSLSLSGVMSSNETTNISYYIGGVSDGLTSAATLQAHFDWIGPECGATNGDPTNNLDILTYKSTAVTLTAKIDIDSISGSDITKIRNISCDSDFVRSDGAVEITTTSAITSLFEFFLESVYTQWYGFEFNGGDGSTDATHCIFNNEDGSFGHTFENCEIHHATSHNVNVRGTSVADFVFLNCDNHHAGNKVGIVSHGYNHSAGGRGAVFIDGGSSHDHGGHGYGINNGKPRCENVLIYGNNGNGLFFNTSSEGASAMGNTIFNNLLSGIKCISIVDRNSNLIYNNSLVKNGLPSSGYGIEYVNDNPYASYYIDYNHFHGNGLGEDDLTVTKGSQNDISGDPLFVSETPGQVGFLRPTSTSPLIDAGVGGTGDTIGALCAEAGTGGVTGISKSRIFGGI